MLKKGIDRVLYSRFVAVSYHRIVCVSLCPWPLLWCLAVEPTYTSSSGFSFSRNFYKNILFSSRDRRSWKFLFSKQFNRTTNYSNKMAKIQEELSTVPHTHTANSENKKMNKFDGTWSRYNGKLYHTSDVTSHICVFKPRAVMKTQFWGINHDKTLSLEKQ